MEDRIRKIMIYATIFLTLAIVVILGIMLKDVFFDKGVPQSPAERAYYLAKALVAKDPKNPGYLLELAKAESDLGKANDAIKNLKKAIEIQPNAPMLHYTLARVYLEAGQEDEAIKELQAELKVTDSKNELAWYDLGVIMLNRKDYNKAVECFKWALIRMSSGADAHYQLGKAYEGLNQNDLAMQHYKEALKYIPDHTEAQVAIQQLQLKLLQQRSTDKDKK